MVYSINGYQSNYNFNFGPQAAYNGPQPNQQTSLWGANNTQMTPQSALQTVLSNFNMFDTANPGKKADDLMAMSDVNALLKDNKNLPPQLMQAAQYLQNNPSIMNSIDTADKAQNNNPDGLASENDIKTWLQQNNEQQQYTANNANPFQPNPFQGNSFNSVPFQQGMNFNAPYQPHHPHQYQQDSFQNNVTNNFFM